MRSLLKTSESRRLELIERLMIATDWMTLNELAQELGSSSRILKEDLVYFNSSNYNFNIESGPLGVRIDVPSNSGISEYYQNVLKTTLAFKIMEEIFFDETLTVNQLASKLRSSSSSIYRAIDELNEYFKTHECQIITNPCRFIGDEHYIRNFYRAYFKEISTMMEWPFRTIVEEKVDHALQSILNSLKSLVELDVTVFDFAFFRIVKIILTVNIIRTNHGQFIEDTREHNGYAQILFNLIERTKCFKNFVAIGINRLDIQTVFQIFSPYMRKNFAYSTKALNKVRKRNPDINNAMAYLENFLQSMADEAGIEVDTDMLTEIAYGTIYLEDDDPNAHHILYDRNYFFALQLQEKFPYLYNNLYKSLSKVRQIMKLPMNDEKVYSLIFAIYTNWDSLIRDLHDKYQQLNVLVISDGHYSHGKMIENLLTFELPDNIEVTTYRNQNLTVDLLNESESDLIISTFKLPDEVQIPYIITKHYPSISDVQRIQTVVEEILDEKAVFALTGRKKVGSGRRWE